MSHMAILVLNVRFLRVMPWLNQVESKFVNLRVVSVNVKTAKNRSKEGRDDET